MHTGTHTQKNTPTSTYIQLHSEQQANTLSDVLDVRRFLSVSVDVIFRWTLFCAAPNMPLLTQRLGGRGKIISEK